MAHHLDTSMYGRLTDRINMVPQGAPPSSSLTAILRILFSEKEAELLSSLPITPFTAQTAARVWSMSEQEAGRILDDLSSRAMLVDMIQNGEQKYCLPPPMAGFFEFSLMRLRNDIDQKALSELFHQYLNVEDDFITKLFVDLDTPLGRIFVQERVLPKTRELEVVSYERASHIIKTASHIGISMCYCRHKMEHLGKVCDAPMEICMTFNTSAASLVKHGHARAVSIEECLDLLSLAQDKDLVQFGENVQEGCNFICNCCGCCCEALLAVKRFALARTIHSNWLAQISPDCIGCGLCVRKCPVDAILPVPPRKSLLSPAMPDMPDMVADTHKGAVQSKYYTVDTERCIGCGVCIRHCKDNYLELLPRLARTITPINTAHRMIINAIELGTLPTVLANNGVFASHRILAGVIGVILSLPVISRELALRQLNSRYMEAIIRRL